MPLETANYFVGLGTLALQILTIGLLGIFVFGKKNPALSKFIHFIGNYGLLIAFLINVAALLSSLYYSEILGLAPCGLCWLQRVFMYPQVVLFAVALWKKDKSIAAYSVALSFFGGIVALYQHYLQTGGEQLLPCPAASAAAVDCAKRFLFEFGYITFPLASFSIFAFLIILMLYVRKSRTL